LQCPPQVSREGSIITCTDFNNVGSVCTAMCKPDYVIDGKETATCQTDGKWTTTDLKCRFVGRQRVN